MKKETATSHLQHELFTSLHHINGFVTLGLNASQKDLNRYFNRIKIGSDNLQEVIKVLVPLLSDEVAEQWQKEFRKNHNEDYNFSSNQGNRK
jgi:hypothetical protein